MILRYPAVSGLALAVTFSLFFIMQHLVATGEDVLQGSIPYKPIIITREIEDKEIVRIPPVPPVIIDEQPPNIPVTRIPIRISDPNDSTPIGGVEATSIPEPSEPTLLAATDRDEAMAIVAIPPRYPQSLAARDVEGYVDVRFDITKTGAVDNAVVTYSTNRGFERSALQAIAKWKFQPRVVDGAPQMQFGVEKRISYVLEQG